MKIWRWKMESPFFDLRCGVLPSLDLWIHIAWRKSMNSCKIWAEFWMELCMLFGSQGGVEQQDISRTWRWATHLYSLYMSCYRYPMVAQGPSISTCIHAYKRHFWGILGDLMYPLVIKHWTWPCLQWLDPLKIVIFHSYLSLPVYHLAVDKG